MNQHHPSCLARTDAEAACICPKARRLPRKTIVLVGTASLALIAGVAFALYLLNAQVAGNVDTRSANYQWVSSPAPSGSGSAATCTVGTPALASNNVLPSINVSGYPGDTCTITASAKTIGAAEDFRVTGAALTGLPNGWTAALAPTSCGKTITGTATPVSFTITVGPSGSGPIAGGLSLAPVSQVGNGALTC